MKPGFGAELGFRALRLGQPAAGKKSGRPGRQRAKRSAMSAFCAGTFALFGAGASFASGPVDGGIGFQPPGTKVAELQDFMHNSVLMPIITAVVLLVLALLVWVVFRYRKSANPVPRKFTHNVTVEVIWTVVPVLILIFISLFSFPILFQQGRVPKDVALTVKARGNQWNWTYFYPDAKGDVNAGFEFTSRLIPDDQIDASKGQKRLMSVDYPLVVPVGQNIQVLVTGSDVIHSWGVPALGVKMDAIPGKLNETWFRVEKPGVYHGFCYELCGIQHSQMPIEVHAVTKKVYEQWLAAASQDVDAGLRVLAATETQTQLASAE